MNSINKTIENISRKAAIFIAAILFVCSIAFFAMPGKKVSADVGQPDIPVPDRKSVV